MEQVKDIMERVAIQAARNMQLEIAERISNQAGAITRLLDNGQTIYLQTLGTRFIKMNLLRNSLHSKAQTLYETAGMIYGIDTSKVKY